MTDALHRFRLNYAPLMLRYLARQDEAGLQAAYQLGREAMREVGLLDIVRVHNDLFLEVLATVHDVEEARILARASTTLLIDLIASFEMSQRAFMDVRRARKAPAEQE